MKTLISAEKIRERVIELAQQLSRDYSSSTRESSLLIVGILRGSFIFLADLVREMQIPVEIDFMEVSSYGVGTTSSGKVELRRDISKELRGRDVLLVEDIIDTGNTMEFLFSHLQARQPRSLKLCSLLHKPSRQARPVTIDYLGFTIDDHFVVGYGLDFDNKYRELKDITILKEP